MTNEAPTTRWRLVIGLLFLAPWIAEFVLGNLPISMVWVGALLAPMYGGAAILIREWARINNLGRAAIPVMGLAFGLVQEGVVTASLFDPGYMGLRLLDRGYVPALGIGSWWTVFVLALHGVWSVTVPIAVIELLAAPDHRGQPWLSPRARGLFIGVFLMGCVSAAMGIPARYQPTSMQLFGALGLAIFAVAAATFCCRRRVPRHPHRARRGRSPRCFS